MVKLREAVAVLAAKSLNVSIFQQVWLLEHGIFNKEEFAGSAVFSPVAVNVPGSNFDFLVVPERVQVVVKSEFDTAHEIFGRTIGRIVKTLPHTPFVALGLNFNYIVDQSNQDTFADACRKVIVGSENPLREEFMSSDARFGFYASRDVLDARLKLDIKPIKLEAREVFLLNFNFHRDVSMPEEINQSIDKWSEIYDYADRLAHLVDDAVENA